MKYFLCVIGMVLILEGLPCFILPDKMKDCLRKLNDMPDHVLRILGLITVSLGLMLLFFGRT